jgi:hypothetical protein
MPAQEAYQPPDPYTVCLWAPALGMEWSPALVTKIGRSGISVVLFSIDARMGLPKDGVVYVNDPRSFKIHPDEGGIWDFTVDQKILRELMGIKDDDFVQAPKKKSGAA